MADEDFRQINRELKTLQEESRRHRNRVQSLLITQGLREKIDRSFGPWLEGPGTSLPPALSRRVRREWERLQLAEEHRRALEKERRELVKTGRAKVAEQCERLMMLKGIGVEGGWTLPAEMFAWREFTNRKQVGGIVGLTPTPFQSGSMNTEQGIDKAGIGRVRTLAVELAWCWLRHQPQSALSRWYREKYSNGGKRLRCVGIVALARKLLIALWRYLDQGIVPDGALMKTKA